MKISLLGFSNTQNIGDNIQTLAVAQHIGQSYDLVDRDFLSDYVGEPCAVVLNGWFSHEPQNWPPSPDITPIFFGFHMTAKTAEIYKQHINYFKKYEPIGCRDQATAEVIRSWGVGAYVSGCATMTFPRRQRKPEDPKLILVDQTRRHFPREQRRGHVQINHQVAPYISSSTKFDMARQLIDYYRDNAGVVVTSRIHCAMPCAAMGIPVLYTGVREGRTEIIDMMGIVSVKTRRFPKTDLKKLRVQAVDFEDKKAQIVADLRSKLQMCGVSLSG